MYYNSSMKSFRCYRDSAWSDCGTHNIEREWVLEDEFVGGLEYAGLSGADGYYGGGIGNLGWEGHALGNSSTSLDIFYNDVINPPTSDRPGTLNMSASGTGNLGTSLILGAGMWDAQGKGSIRLAANTVFKTSVQSDQATGFDARIGFHGKMSIESRSTEPTGGVWFGVNATQKWELCYYGKVGSGDANAVRCTDSNVATTTAWTRLELRIVSLTTGAVTIDYYINGVKYTPTGNGSIYSVVTDAASTLGVSPVIQWWNTNSTDKQLAIDYAQIRGTSSAAR
jgi:hypothetical protein